MSPPLLIATTTFPRWQDDPGPAPFVFHLARALADHFEVTVLAPHAPGAAIREQMDGVKVRRFRYAPGRLERLTDGAGIMNNLRRSGGGWLAAPLLIAGEALALAAAAKPGTAVNCHWLVPSGLLGALFASGRALVVTCHAADYDLLSRVPGGGAVIRFIARRAVIVAVSERLAAGIRAAAPHARVETLPMGVEVERFRFDEADRRAWRDRLAVAENERLILFAGKLSPKKGVKFLVEAVALMSGRPRLAVAGDGDERPALERLTADILPDRARFLGAMPNHELARLYSAADAVALPSVRDERGETEGMPVVALEALAAGRPVVATTLCSLPRGLIGRGAIEIQPADAPALAAALTSAINGPLPATDAVSPWDWKRVAERYAQLLGGARA